MSQDDAEDRDVRLPRETSVLFGHAEAEGALLDSYKSGRMPHAWLIGGPPGIGKATLAYRMARFVLANPDPSRTQSATSLALPADHRVTRQIAAQGHPDLLALERSISAKSHHLRDPRLGMGGVDADADRLVDRFGLAAPKPGPGGKVGETGSAGASRAVASGAIVNEERATRLSDMSHQVRIGGDFAKARLSDAVGPWSPGGGSVFDLPRHDGALVNAQQQYDSAKYTLDGMLASNRGASSEAIQNAQAQYTLAKNSLEQAQNFYNYVKDRPDDDPQKAQAYTALYSAQQAADRA